MTPYLISRRVTGGGGAVGGAPCPVARRRRRAGGGGGDAARPRDEGVVVDTAAPAPLLDGGERGGARPAQRHRIVTAVGRQVGRVPPAHIVNGKQEVDHLGVGGGGGGGGCRWPRGGREGDARGGPLWRVLLSADRERGGRRSLRDRARPVGNRVGGGREGGEDGVQERRAGGHGPPRGGRRQSRGSAANGRRNKQQWVAEVLAERCGRLQHLVRPATSGRAVAAPARRQAAGQCEHRDRDDNDMHASGVSNRICPCHVDENHPFACRRDATV